MAYIGKQPVVGNFVKLDAITTSATATFNLTNGGVAYSPQSANHCLVSLNGVIQEPTSASNVGGFTISGSTIVFTSALTSLDVIDFILVLGDVLNIGTPSDNTVSLAKLTATGTKDATTFLRGDNTFATPAGGTNTPAFLAYRSTQQTITASTYVKVQIDTEVYDTNSNYDSSTNYRFTPTTAGKYFVYGAIWHDWNTNWGDQQYTLIYKNGSVIAQWFNAQNTTSSGQYGTLYIATTVDMNGSTDYLELYGRSNAVAPFFTQGISNTYFGAYKLIGV